MNLMITMRDTHQMAFPPTHTRPLREVVLSWSAMRPDNFRMTLADIGPNEQTKSRCLDFDLHVEVLNRPTGIRDLLVASEVFQTIVLAEAMADAFRTAVFNARGMMKTVTDITETAAEPG